MTGSALNLSRRLTFTNRRAWIFSLLLGATALMRLIGLGRYGFDEAEVFCINAASADWLGLFVTVASHVSHPPLFFMLLKVWLLFGDQSEFWVRLLPAIIGTAVIVPVYRLCNLVRLGDRETGLVLSLVAFNGFIISLSQDARMFSLLQLTSTTSIYVFAKLFCQPAPSRRDFYWLTAVNVLLVYSHYWGWFVVAAELCALCALDRAKLGFFLRSTIWVAVAFVPWAFAVLFVVINSGSVFSQISWILEPNVIMAQIWLLAVLNGAPEFPHSTAVGILLFGILILALMWQSRKILLLPSNHQVPLTCWMILGGLPVVLTLTVSYLSGQSVWGERHLIVVATPYFMLVGIALSRITWPKIAAVTQCVLLSWIILAGVQSLSDTHQKLDWRSLALFIARETYPGQQPHVYTLDAFIALPLDFQLARLDEPKLDVRTEADPSGINDRAFWLVYRKVSDRPWQFPDTFEHLFEARGFVIDKQQSTRTKFQTVTALLLRRAS